MDMNGLCGPERIPEPSGDMSRLIAVVTSTMIGNSVDLETVPMPFNETEPEGADAVDDTIEFHPCNPIEKVPPEHIWEVYGDLEENSPRTMWRDLDLLLCDGGADIEQRFKHLRERLDTFCNQYRPERHTPRIMNMQPRGEAMWYDAAMLRAALPAFRDRLVIGGVSPQAARQSYQMLVADVMPYVQNSGTLAETIVAALLAKIDPEAYAFPASLREERSTYKSSSGKLFNHDLYQLPNPAALKVPLQVKLTGNSDSGTYDSSIVRVHLHEWLTRPVLGRDYSRVHPRQAHSPLAFLDYVRQAFVEPTRRGDAMLHEAALYLDDRILREARAPAAS